MLRDCLWSASLRLSVLNHGTPWKRKETVEGPSIFHPFHIFHPLHDSNPPPTAFMRMTRTLSAPLRPKPL
jgi:hypothetical protein